MNPVSQHRITVVNAVAWRKRKGITGQRQRHAFRLES
jgi:hypothetical protein